MLSVVVFSWVGVVVRKAELATGAQRTRLRLRNARLSVSCDEYPGLCLVSHFRMRRTVLHSTILPSQCEMRSCGPKSRGFGDECGLGLRHPNIGEAVPHRVRERAAWFRAAGAINPDIIAPQAANEGTPRPPA